MRNIRVLLPGVDEELAAAEPFHPWLIKWVTWGWSVCEGVALVKPVSILNLCSSWICVVLILCSHTTT